MRPMKAMRGKANILVILFVALLSLSLVAGVLLHQWINRASEADRMERQQLLDASLRGFRGEFSEAIKEIPLFFRPASRPQQIPVVESHLLELFAQWQKGAHRPQLVQTFYVGTLSNNKKFFFRQYLGAEEKKSNRFEKREWPESLSWFRKLVEERQRRPGKAGARGPESGKQKQGEQQPREPEIPIPQGGYVLAYLNEKPVLAFPLVSLQGRLGPPPWMPDGRRGPPFPGMPFFPGRRPINPGELPPRTDRQSPPPQSEGDPNLPRRRPPGPDRPGPGGSGPGGSGKDGPPPFARQGPPPGFRPPWLGPGPPGGNFPRRPPWRGGWRNPSPQLIGFYFLELDEEFLQQQLLPELAQKHFGGSILASYQLEIVTSDRRDVIYTFGGEAAPEPTQFQDGETPLFIPGTDLGLESLNPPPDNGSESSEERQKRLASSPALRSGEPAKLPAGSWMLIARHREGSIQTVVNRLRFRDRMVGFGVLSLLVFSVSLILLTTHKARALAKRQMEFVAGVSHELRTPLSVIQSAGFNLSSGRVKDARRVQQYGTMIQSEGRRLTDMIEQMLSYAGIQSGRNRYRFEETQVSEVIDAAIHEFAPALEAGDWQVEKQVSENLPPVSADSSALQSAIKNLIQNSMKYAANGKWLRISASTNGDKRPQVRITVEDRGQGIDAADLPHIFEPFYRGQEVLASSTPGAGLGLSLLQRHIKAHGGRVTVKSAPGEGTIFTLYLPAADAKIRTSHQMSEEHDE